MRQWPSHPMRCFFHIPELLLSCLEELELPTPISHLPQPPSLQHNLDCSESRKLDQLLMNSKLISQCCCRKLVWAQENEPGEDWKASKAPGPQEDLVDPHTEGVPFIGSLTDDQVEEEETTPCLVNTPPHSPPPDSSSPTSQKPTDCSTMKNKIIQLLKDLSRMATNIYLVLLEKL